MEDFPSNSKKSQTESKKEMLASARIEGAATQQKRTLGRRFREAIMGDDTRSVWSYVFTEILVEGTKDMIFNAGTEALAQRLNVDGRGARAYGRRSTGSGGFNYQNQFASAPPQRRELNPQSRARHDFGDILIPTRHEAAGILDMLHNIVAQYGAASVGDLYDLCNIDGTPQDEKYGWYDISAATVRPTRGQYLLMLPTPVVLD